MVNDINVAIGQLLPAPEYQQFLANWQAGPLSHDNYLRELMRQTRATAEYNAEVGKTP